MALVRVTTRSGEIRVAKISQGKCREETSGRVRRDKLLRGS